MKLIFEYSHPERKADLVPAPCIDVPQLDDRYMRHTTLELPEVAEIDVDRHYQGLSKETFGVCDGFYPLGSCTMKYNPRINEQVAGLPGFAHIHPLQPTSTTQGMLAALYETGELLADITGMDTTTLQPAAGAHGELCGMLLIRAYHESRGDTQRTEVIVPDSAHGTNPATASMAGFETINIPSNAQGGVDLDALREAVGPQTAGLMLTNPNTLGIFDPAIEEICRIIHEAGGLCYYDGANLNPIMGVVRPGDMGFDCVHLNLHKTFSTPHGGGGPGSGAVGCKAFLAPFLPGPVIEKHEEDDQVHYSLETPEHSIGRLRSFYGNVGIALRALAYIRALGRKGIPESAQTAVLNANYLMNKVKDAFDVAFEGPCMHEFVLTLDALKDETGVRALDVAKRLLDFGVHPPTMYFPLIVHEALMVEPTETETRETLDAAASVFVQIAEEAHTNPEMLQTAPHHTRVGRPDETTAARSPIVRWQANESA